MATVDTAVCTEVQKRVEEHLDRQDKDIADTKDRVKKVEELNITMGEILKQITESTADQERRIKELELKPGKRYDYIVQNVIQWIVIAVLAMSKLFQT